MTDSVYPWIKGPPVADRRKAADAVPSPVGSLMPPGLLKRIGKALMGGNWQVLMARELGINPRNFRYMAMGRRAIHAGHAADLLDLIEAKARTSDRDFAADLRSMAGQLRAFL